MGKPRSPRQLDVTRRAKKLMWGLLQTQKIANGRQREEAWLRCRKLAEEMLEADERKRMYSANPADWIDPTILEKHFADPL